MACVLGDKALDPTNQDAPFDPALHFNEWQQSLEDFRLRRETAELVPSVYLAAGDPDCPEPLSLDEQFADEIRSEGTLVVTEYGNLHADVAVTVAVIDGVFKGKVAASEQVILKNHALVIGEINTPALTITGGAIIEGRCYFQPPPEAVVAPEWQASAAQTLIDAAPQDWERPRFQAFRVGFAKAWRSRIFQ
jgi:cytoskeletal protein CcmA (bactofilin family)